MFRASRSLSSLVKQRYTLSCTRYVHTTKTAKVSKPLRILFCGSDKFSSEALKALHTERTRNPELIASIDVVCRPGKRTGRFLKTIREVPIKSVAKALGLPIHERDTFTGWAPPAPEGEPINLIIAVSFGLLVPPRIINGAEYGGINVHPSLLPDLHGPAPLQHALISGDTHIGVTLQTLHPSKFDQGTILEQTPLPGFPIPKAGRVTYPELLDFVTPKAAELLVTGVRHKAFVPPVKALTLNTGERPIRHAPKLTTADRQVDLFLQSTDDLLRRNRVLGRLWILLKVPADNEKRIIFEDIMQWEEPQAWKDFKQWRKENPTMEDQEMGLGPECDFPIYTAQFFNGKNSLQTFVYTKDEHNAIIIPQKSGGAIRVEQITVEGGKKKAAFKALEIKEESSWSGYESFPQRDFSPSSNIDAQATGSQEPV